jgi:hypothetical protein
MNLNKIILLLLILIASFSASADLEIIVAKESELPFQLSPSKFDNSQSKFDNSVSKFSNSPSKFSNSPSKFENSPSKFENGKTGERRLLLNQSGKHYYVGYYVWGDDGIMNFFSSKGTRLFYSPSSTGAIFDGESGDFSGSLAIIKNKDVLVITDKGQIAFAKDGVSLTESSKPKAKTESGYAGGSSGHWIQENIDSGKLIILEDGSIWEIDPLEQIDAMLWLPISEITVVTSGSGSPGYEYLLINTDDNEKAHAKLIGRK